MLKDLFLITIICLCACVCVIVCEHMSEVIVQLRRRLRDSCDTGIITDAELMFVWMQLEFYLFLFSFLTIYLSYILV